jgi:hypothetical protein
MGKGADARQADPMVLLVFSPDWCHGKMGMAHTPPPIAADTSSSVNRG